MIRLTPTDDLSHYTQLNSNDPHVCQKATHYDIVPSRDNPGWDDVIYYRHISSPSISYISKSNTSTRVRVDFNSK
jgi:hypothetical protein